MADIQKQFEQFHSKIRVDFDMSNELRDKRDIVVAKIRKYLKDNGLPGVTVLLQGSYKIKTGVKPIGDLEYDIDIGLRFDFHENDHTATDVRTWVYNAVKDHTDRCEDKGPCIRVVYEKGFHLDLVTYCVFKDFLSSEKYRLAHKEKGWLDADPPKLLDHVAKCRESFSETEDNETKTDQFRRVVRALRRWNDVRKPYESDQKPTGLALVILCCERLAKAVFVDGRADDRKALEKLCRDVSGTWSRIKATKPTPQYEEMFSRLTDEEMTEFKVDMGKLADALKKAGETTDPVEACKALRPFFGDDFPVPDPVDTGTKTKAPAIVTSSVSAQ